MFKEGAESLLRWDNSTKIETTSVGVNITGNVDCDSLNNAGITTLGSTVTTAGKITANVNGTGLHLVSTSTESNILLQNDARTWKIVNYDYGTGADNLGFHDGSGDRLIISHTTGNATFGGAVTADSFSGDGSSLTGIGVTIAPLNYNPNPGATGVKYNTGIGATFNQAVIAGSGNVTLSIATNAGAAGTTVENFGVGSSVTIAGRKATISPASDLTEGDTYHISYPSGAFTNTGGDVDYVGTAYTFGVVKYIRELFMWGDNTAGGLGLNQADSVEISSPTQIPGNNWEYVSVSGQYNTVHSIKTDGTLWNWGKNQSGVLGQNNNVDYSSPVQIPGTTWKSIRGGYRTALATKTDGTLWACLLYTSPSPRDRQKSRMPSSA